MAISVQDLVSDSGPVLDACLLCIIGIKKRGMAFPALTALVTFDLLWAVGNRVAGVGYSWLGYTILDLISVGIQFALIAELLAKVVPSQNKLAPQARRLFFRLAVGGVVIALLPVLMFRPPHFHPLALYLTKLDLLAGLLICEAVIAMMLAAQKVGLGWRNHVLAVGQGLMLWTFSYVLVEGIGPYLAWNKGMTDSLYYFRSVVYLVTLAYWSVSLWREEPARKPISPEMRKYIVALHDRVHYDLGKVGH